MLIDSIFVNNFDKLLARGNIISDISDHFSQFCSTTSARDKEQQIKSVKMRDYSRFSADSFAKDLLEVDCDRVIANGANCPDKLFSTFYNKYNKIVNKHAPFKGMPNRKAKQLSKSWIPTAIKALIAVKSKLYASGDDSRYKYYRNQICSLIWLSKKRYYYEYFEHNVDNMKKKKNLGRN